MTKKRQFTREKLQFTGSMLLADLQPTHSLTYVACMGTAAPHPVYQDRCWIRQLLADSRPKNMCEVYTCDK